MDTDTLHTLRVKKHAEEAQRRIDMLIRGGWYIEHDNGATVVLNKDATYVPGDFVPGNLRVTIHRDYYTHWYVLTQ